MGFQSPPKSCLTSSFSALREFRFPSHLCLPAGCALRLRFLGLGSGLASLCIYLSALPFLPESTTPMVELEPTASGLTPSAKPAHGAHQPKTPRFLVCFGGSRKEGREQHPPDPMSSISSYILHRFAKAL